MGDYTPESWEYARGYAGILGNLPSSFSSVIRSLIQEHNTGGTLKSGNTKYFVIRLLKSPSLRSPFFFASKGFFPQDSVGGTISPEEIIAKYSTFDIAYIMGAVYLLRRAKVVCDAEELAHITKPIIQNLNLGFVLGRAVPAIGSGMGLIEGSIRHFALACFLKHDKKTYKEYRREIKRNGGELSAEDESERWGCNSLQVASVILQTLGFGIPRSNAFVNAFSSKSDAGSPEEIKFATDFRMAAVWRETLVSGKREPSMGLPAKYYPAKEALRDALQTLERMRNDPNLWGWVEKGKEDFLAAAKAVEAEEEGDDEVQDELEAMEQPAPPSEDQ